MKKPKGLSSLSNKQLNKIIDFLTFKRFKFWSILLIILVAIFLGPLFFFFIFLFIAFYYSVKRFKEQREFMQNFASSNNFRYQEKLENSNFAGRLFKVGHSRKAYNGIIGNYKDYPIQIFDYNFTVGSGKNQTTYSFTICEIQIEKTQFPHIFLKSDSMWMRHQKMDMFGQDKDVRIKLEKPFEKKFNLYCTQDYEIEVLQIFTEDLLQYLVDNGNHFSIEFASNKLYIYDDRIIRKQEKMDELLNVVKGVLDRSGPLMKRLHDDFEAMHEAYGLKF
jgi:hypothetical protein